MRRKRKEKMRATSSNSLLGLPPAIRRQIYLESGVCTGQRIDLSPRARVRYDSAGARCLVRHWRGLYSLLFICRTIYTELSHIIYSENNIIVQHSSREEGFQAVRNLTTVSTSALRSLTVHLNGDPCCLYGCCGRHMDVLKISCPNRGCKESLANFGHYDQKLLEDWLRTLDYITANVKPFSLEMYLISDVHDHETALQIVHPIIKFAKFKRCVIRLCHDRDSALERLAEATALRAIGGQQLHESSPPRLSFLDLPREIRNQVLQYTDLVTPMKEVMWNPKDGYSVCYCISNFDEEAEAFFEKTSAISHSFKFRNCWATSRVGCFCRRFHAVSSSSSMCHCWSPPTSLFLVCHDILDAARMVFFSNNRFIITSSNGPNAIAETTPERLEASVFLTDVVPFTSLRWLRSLELVFPPFEDDYLRHTEPAYSDWLHTIDYIKNELHTPMINLHVHMADPETDNGTVVGGRIYRPNLTGDQYMKVFAMYYRLLKTFPPLDRFKGFTMHLAVPFWWDETGYHRPQLTHETLQIYEKARVHMQEICGREIIGDKIDQVLMDSNRRSDSQWLELTWTKYEQTIG